jgi:carboxymethylenebutenolidase
MQILALDTPDGPMSLFMAEPTGPPRGAIVVIQEAFGVTPHIQGVCEWLAEHGWLAVAPALFHRADIEVFDYDDLQGALPVMMTLTRESIDTDVDSVLSYLALFGYGPDRTGLVGFCMGGSVALYAAATRPLGAAVTFYGGGLAQGRFGFASGLELGEQINVPWLGLYGDQDQSIPVDDVELLRARAAARPVPTEVVRYEHGLHGFNCDDRPSVFDADIAADARRRTLAWFDEHLA